MSENKADQLKRVSNEKADEAEAKVKQGVMEVEKSHVGKKIPTFIREIHIKTIIYCILFCMLQNSIVFYLLMSVNEHTNPSKQFAISILLICWLGLGVLATLFDFVLVAMKFALFFKIAIVLKVLKTVNMLISLVLINFTNMVATLLFLYVLLGMFLTDVFYLYYTVLYFERIQSDDFDEEGRPKNKT